MLVGVPKEIKDNEFRVGMTPAAVAELVDHGHEVIVETSAGLGSGSPDEEYVRAGGKIVETGADVFAQADMVVKVKEPLAEERKRLGAGRCCSPTASCADLEQTRDLMASGATCIAYETVTPVWRTAAADAHVRSRRPARAAGRRACSREAQGGRGVLLGGVPGVAAADVLILGGGVSGSHAATIAVGMGASVTVVDRSHEALSGSRPVRLGAAHGLFDARLDRRSRQARRPRHRRGAVARRGRAQAHHPRDAEDDAPGRGHRRHRHRPGRLLRDVEADDAFAPDLCGGRHRALLRRQHAGRGRAHLDLRPQQCDPAVRARARRQGLAQGAQRGSAPARRPQRAQRQADLRAGRRGARAPLHPCGKRAQRVTARSPSRPKPLDSTRAPIPSKQRSRYFAYPRHCIATAEARLL